MFLIASSVNINTFLGWLVHRVTANFNFQANQTYDYTDCVSGSDYVFEALDDDRTGGYMSARWKSIRCGDYIILPKTSGTEKYQVEKIDYYSEPSDMWIALLRRVNQ